MRHVIHRVALLAVLCLAAPVASVAAPAASPEDAAARETAAATAAEKAAGAWLKLTDEGRYAESWDAAAQFFKNAVPKEQWVKQLGAVRKPFGAVLKREVKSKKYATALPGAPDAPYVVIQYETSFAGKKASVETVTPTLERDGTWRVCGYFVR